jgi:hypothetical protein
VIVILIESANRCLLPGPLQLSVAFVREHGLEGIVAKRADSVYQPGKRSGLWTKHRISLGQEFVVGGYIPSKDPAHNITNSEHFFFPASRTIVRTRLFQLGHSSTQTTERYLGSEQEIAIAVNESLGL